VARQISISKVIKDQSIFPRGHVDQEAVMRYRDAYELGEELPALILEKGTDRLLDGWHRMAALEELQADKVAAEYHLVPEGVPALLYAAGLSSRHGVILSNREKSQIAVQVYGADDTTPFDLIAHQLAVHPNTVRNWVGEIIKARQASDERRIDVRRGAVALLLPAGWTQQAVADLFGVDHKTIGSDYKVVDAPKDRLVTDPAYAADVLAALPAAELEQAQARIAEWATAEQDLINKRRQAAQITKAWRDLEEAARYATAWIKSGGQIPDTTAPDRITYIRDALTLCVQHLED
jgi:hypothetical protein